ncbi:MAG: 50S ribosomal protein L25/general stress protein Ctc [Proteobacteria bacterium]|nr:50S ribosomal protein L25/general stress protein Ctc [Pseudomonadota bacterium]
MAATSSSSKLEFTAFPRAGEGRGASRRLRHAGKAPGIVYGGTDKPAAIELDHNALWHALKNEAFHSSILTMTLGNAKQRVLLRDVQMHPYRPQVLHIDFQRIDENKKIHMKVPLHFVNAEVSPAVKLGGAIISHVMTEIDVACLPKDLPEFIAVDLSAIEIGHAIKVSELKLGDGVTAVTHGKDPVVATAVVPRAVAEAEDTATADAAAAPAADAKAGDAKASDAKAADAKGGDKKK